MFCFTTPVRFADIDHAGIVYFARFFHYCHLALEEFFRERIGGRAYADLLDRERIGFPAVQTECSFLAPLRFGDTMDIELEIARLGGKSVTCSGRVFRHRSEDEGGGRDLCGRGRYVTAIVDLEAFRAVPIPERLREILQPLLATTDDSQHGAAAAGE